MRYPIVLLFVLLYGAVGAQQRVAMSVKTGSKYSRYVEDFFALKTDKTIKDGPYQMSLNDKLLVSGYYTHGQKDSVWEAYTSRGVLLSRRHYNNGQRTGTWEFFNSSGDLQWTYDFTTNTPGYQEGVHPYADMTVYQTDSNAWVRGHLDKPLLALNSNGEWLNFLNRTMRYPEDAVSQNVQGTVTVTITIDEKGDILGYMLTKTVGASLDMEAMRVVRLFPFEFIPGEINGKKVKTRFDVPIRFKLEN